MNDDRRQILARCFDGESVVDDPHEAVKDAESLAYLRRLSLLRELAVRHDPAAAGSPRQPVFVVPRSRWPIPATIVAVAASLVFMIVIRRDGPRADRESGSIADARARPAAGPSTARVPIRIRRSPQPPLEVELYRWANESAPYREDSAGVVLSLASRLVGRPASREILALVLANATPGSSIKLPRLVASRATSTPGSVRKLGTSRRHRPSPLPRA